MKETELKPCEIWKDIKGFEGWYQVSNFGNVRRIAPVNGSPRCKNIKPWVNSRGYSYVTLNVRCKKTMFRLHRLVADHFIEKQSDTYTDINHIDGNKQNNAVDNLEWCTRSENMKHAIKTGLFYPKKGARKVCRQ